MQKKSSFVYAIAAGVVGCFDWCHLFTGVRATGSKTSNTDDYQMQSASSS